MNGYEQMREACANIAEYAKSAQCHTEDTHVLGYLRQMENWAHAALLTVAAIAEHHAERNRRNKRRQRARDANNAKEAGNGKA